MMIYIYLLTIVIFPLLLAATLPLKIFIEKSVLNSSIRSKTPGRFVRLSKGYTHYEITGGAGKPVVLFIHGFSVPYYMWDKTFIPVAESGYRVIRFDTYGRGFSDRPDTVYDKKLFVGQIIELLDSLGVTDKINIIGTSMGGAITAAFAAEYPEYINRIVLIDPVYTPHDISLLRYPVIGEFIAYIFKIPHFPKRQMTDFFRPEKFPEWPGRYMEQMKYRGFRRAILSTCRNFLSVDPRPYYESLKEHNKKVLLIWGREDKVTPINDGEKLKSVLSSEYLVIDEAGHLPHYETPEIVNNAIISFFNNTGL